MKKTIEQLQSDFLEIQHKGKQSLRLFLLGIFFLLLVYCVLIGYLMSITYIDFNEHIFSYLWRVGLQVLWIIPLWLLWKYHKIGRVLYFGCLVYTLYGLKDMYQYVLEAQQTFTLNHYLLLIVACGWRICLCLGQFKLFHNSNIRSIWSVYDMFDDELKEEIEPYKEEPVIIKDTPVTKKAKKFLHKYSIGMGIFLYSFIVLVLLFLLILKTQSPSMKESIEIIERTLFGNFLFSAFLWIAPIMAMYMYHSSTRWLLLLCILGELTKIILSFSSYLYIFTSPLVNASGKSIFVVIECLRYTMLILWSLKVLRNPYSYRLWQKKKEI